MDLELAEVIHDFRLAPVDGSDEFAAQNPLPIDDVSFGKFECPVKIVAFVVWIAHGQQVDLVSLQKMLVRALIDVNADGQHFYTLALHPLLHLYQ